MSKTHVQLPESQVNTLYSTFEKEAIEFAKQDRGKNKENGLSLDDSPVFVSSSENDSLTISFYEFCLRLKELYNIQMNYITDEGIGYFKVVNDDLQPEYKKQLELSASKFISKGGVDYTEWLNFEYDNIIRTDDNEKIFTEIFDSVSERYLKNPQEFFKNHLSLEDDEVSQLMYTITNDIDYLQFVDIVTKYGKEYSHSLFLENSEKYLKNKLDFVKSFLKSQDENDTISEELLKKADVDGDGKINYQEFLYLISLTNELEP